MLKQDVCLPVAYDLANSRSSTVFLISKAYDMFREGQKLFFCRRVSTPPPLPSLGKSPLQNP